MLKHCTADVAPRTTSFQAYWTNITTLKKNPQKTTTKQQHYNTEFMQ